MSNNKQNFWFRKLSLITQPIWISVLLIFLSLNSVCASSLFDQSFRTDINQIFSFDHNAVSEVPGLSINNTGSGSEGNSGTKQVSFNIVLSAVSDQTVTIDFATADDTAIAGEDYVAASGTLIFAPGERVKTVLVTIIGDSTIEPDETFNIFLSKPVNATILRNIGSSEIVNDDSGGILQFSASEFVVNERAGTATITVTRTDGTASGVSVNYSTSNGTATAGQDYIAASGTLNFAADEISKTFTIPIINDAVIEPNETINLSLSNIVGGTIFRSPSYTAVLTIADDDGAPSLSINNVTANEGQSGTTAFNFTVSLSGTTNQIVTVNYATADGTAKTPANYQTTSGSLTFAPGETAKTVTVLVNGERFFGSNQTFMVNLSNAVNASVTNAQGTGTILDDDYDSSFPCSFNVSPKNINVSAEAASGNMISIFIKGSPNNNCGSFNSSSNNSFITIDSRYYPYVNGSGVGTVIFSLAANTGLARSGTLSVAGTRITINQAAAKITAAQKVSSDFDGDGKADISVFRPSNGFWYVSKSSGGFSALQWGQDKDVPVPGDYDGDGKTDLAVYRRGTGSATVLGDPIVPDVWYVLRSSDNTFYTRNLGLQNGLINIPVPADFDGDGKTDLAIYSSEDGIPSPGYYVVLQSSTNTKITTQWGLNSDKIVPADYDGDGRADLAVVRNGVWYIWQSATGTLRVEYFGLASDRFVPADYDGDGRADLAVWRLSNGVWYRINSADKSFVAFQFGLNTDTPAPADYDGDGKTDIAVFRPSTGVWYLQQSSKGFRAEQFGQSSDIPVSSQNPK